MKIVIDPGHGGRDPGAIGPDGLREKDIALAISKRLVAHLTPEIQAVLTRASDKHLGASKKADLAARARLANQAQANCFISIHCNSAGNSVATGIETFALGPGGQGEKLARFIQAELIRETELADRGVKFANFKVLRDTAMPAVLAELGFVSNPAEEKLLRNPIWQDKAAQAIAKGVRAYLGIEGRQQDLEQIDVEIKINANLKGVLVDGRTLIPARDVVEILQKIQIFWEERDRTVTIKGA